MEVQHSAIGQICTEPFSQNLVITFGYQKAAYLPAGGLRNTQSLKTRLQYVLSLRLLVAAENHLPPIMISITVSTLTPNKIIHNNCEGPP